LLAFHSFQAITFDCYGTLIDWESAILRVLRPMLFEHGKPMADQEILALFAELEPPIQSAGYKPYRFVLEEVLRGVGQRCGAQRGHRIGILRGHHDHIRRSDRS